MHRCTPLMIAAVFLFISCGGAPGIGERGQLVSGADQVAVATREQAFDALIKAQVAKDAYGAGQLAVTGQVFLVPSNTSVLVLEGGALKTRVRILSGDKTGQSGWVPVEYVQRR